MTKQIKKNTTRKTIVTKKVVAKKSNRKEEYVMTLEDVTTRFMMDYNNYQEYRQEKNKSYNYAKKETVIQFINKLTKEEQNALIATYRYQNHIQNKLAQQIYNQKLLDRIYGKEDIHPSELNKDSELTIKEQKALLRKQLRELEKKEKEQA